MPHGINWHCCLLGVAKVHISSDLTKYKLVFICLKQCFWANSLEVSNTSRIFAA